MGRSALAKPGTRLTGYAQKSGLSTARAAHVSSYQVSRSPGEYLDTLNSATSLGIGATVVPVPVQTRSIRSQRYLHLGARPLGRGVVLSGPRGTRRLGHIKYSGRQIPTQITIGARGTTTRNFSRQ